MDRDNSARFLTTFNTQLRSGQNSFSDLIYAIATDQNLNKFSYEEIDNYLVQWELIDRLVKVGLIDDTSAYAMFSYDVEQAYCSSYIKKFVLDVRSEGGADTQDYTGFTDLANHFLKEDTKAPCDGSQY